MVPMMASYELRRLGKVFNRKHNGNHPTHYWRMWSNGKKRIYWFRTDLAGFNNLWYEWLNTTSPLAIEIRRSLAEAYISGLNRYAYDIEIDPKAKGFRKYMFKVIIYGQ